MLEIVSDNSDLFDRFARGECETNERGEISTLAWRWVLERNLALAREWKPSPAVLRLRCDINQRLARLNRLERAGIFFVPLRD